MRATDLETSVNPYELVGDFYRLLCVLCMLFGYAYADTKPDDSGFCDLFALMKGTPTEVRMPGSTDKSLIVFSKLAQLKSTGRLINW